MTHYCIHCADPIPAPRAALGYTTCLSCGERIARQRKHTIVNMHKSNYMLFTDPSMLKQLNPKR